MFKKEFLARATLAAGRPVTRGMLEHCHRAGYVAIPHKRSGRYWYDDSHLRQMLEHLQQRGRFVPPEVAQLIAQAEKVGASLQAASDMEAASDV